MNAKDEIMKEKEYILEYYNHYIKDKKPEIEMISPWNELKRLLGLSEKK